MADGTAASQTGLPYCGDKRTGRREGGVGGKEEWAGGRPYTPAPAARATLAARREEAGSEMAAKGKAES